MNKNKWIALVLIVSCLPNAHAKYYSQCQQDKFINEFFFKNKKNGVFVDIGAHDGMSFSNTYFFESELGWHGICIEPLPEIFSQLQKNRKCICINGCISNKSGEAQFLKVGGPCEIQMLSGLLEKYDPRHVNRIKRELASCGGMATIISVPCFTINEILKKYNTFHIDYLSIDTEGGELDILKSIDFDTFDIKIIDVENNYNDPEFRNFLEKKGYTYVTTLAWQDEIYAKNV
ncbi:MAG: FkbM family methyltransferase [bacterium]|nr:FkbM family methyltransferase [bacterium]